MPPPEHHRSNRIGWLRASVLGANDGILSTASLVVGVASANSARADIMLAGVAAMVAGAMSMAAGEYVSVYSQADTEKADLAMEERALEENPEDELKELAGFYQERGLDAKLARQVAEKLTEHDALWAHAREELGITPHRMARPLEAAFSSAGAFAAGACAPLLTAYLAPANAIVWSVAGVSLGALAILGAVAARAGGASIWRGAVRVLFWGAFAMGLTGLVGRLFDVAV